MEMLFMICADPWHKEVCFHGGCICSLHCPVPPSAGAEDQLGACRLPGEPSILLGSLVSSRRSGGGERAGCSVWGNTSSTSFVPPGCWMGDGCKGPALTSAALLEENPQQGWVKEGEKTPCHLQGGEGSC